MRHLRGGEYITPNISYINETKGVKSEAYIPPPPPVQALNEIWYTSSDGNIVTPYTTNVFGANIVSNTYENGKGIIKFDGDVTSIGNYAFSDCTSLTSITIPDSVTMIGYGAFDYCTSLTSVTIGNSVTLIRISAFGSCTSLTSVTIPDSVIWIEESAFYDCTSLTSVTIGNSVTEIEYGAFAGCTSLKAFYGKYASTDNRCLIVNGVLNSFAPVGLTEYTIPDSITEIGYGVFMECSSLTSITIPDSVTSFGEGAFAGCTSLTSITIPDSVTWIGYGAFYECSSLTSVYCKPTTPPSGDSDMFYNNASDRMIYVPRNSVSIYKSTSGWNEYASYIVGYDF